MKTIITSTHIVVEDGERRHAVPLGAVATDCGGNEADTFRDCIAEGTPIWCVDDAARGQSSYGMHGWLYVGAAGHAADRRVVNTYINKPRWRQR
jgi:hypothetical protein